jgi:hypothetical protein
MDLIELLQFGDCFQDVIVKEGQIDSERKDKKHLTTKERSVKRRRKMQNSQSMKSTRSPSSDGSCIIIVSMEGQPHMDLGRSTWMTERRWHQKQVFTLIIEIIAMKTESAVVFALPQLTATFMLTLNSACCSYLEQAFWQKRYPTRG